MNHSFRNIVDAAAQLRMDGHEELADRMDVTLDRVAVLHGMVRGLSLLGEGTVLCGSTAQALKDAAAAAEGPPCPTCERTKATA